jgi:hypothetical protein
MIEIIVKMPSLSPTLKWLCVSLAPTGDQLYLNPQSEYTKKLIAAIPGHAV